MSIKKCLQHVAGNIEKNLKIHHKSTECIIYIRILLPATCRKLINITGTYIVSKINKIFNNNLS